MAERPRVTPAQIRRRRLAALALVVLAVGAVRAALEAGRDKLAAAIT